MYIPRSFNPAEMTSKTFVSYITYAITFLCLVWHKRKRHYTYVSRLTTCELHSTQSNYRNSVRNMYVSISFTVYVIGTMHTVKHSIRSNEFFLNSDIYSCVYDKIPSWRFMCGQRLIGSMQRGYGKTDHSNNRVLTSIFNTMRWIKSDCTYHWK